MAKYKITSARIGTAAKGAEFELKDGASEEEIHEAAWEAVAENVEFDYELIEDDESK